MTNSTKETVQLAVIGAGPGGYAAAFLAADLGMDVALIDPAANPGGVCLYRGCIPSKALLHAARAIEDAQNAGEMGIAFGKPDIDLARLRGWKNGVVSKLTEGLGQLARQRKIRHVQGRAAFAGPNELIVRGADGSRTPLRFENAVIASGSHGVIPDALATGSPRLMNSCAALDLEDVPKRLLVVGGGYIGLELGSVYAALGSEVWTVEMTGGLLPGVDRDLVRPLVKRLEKTFSRILLNARVRSLKEDGESLCAAIETGPGETETHAFDKALVAVGRAPSTEALQLENAGIETDGKGFIATDAQRRTSQPGVFAIGDVAGQPMLAHKAAREGRTAVEVIAGKNVSFNPLAIPAVVFTNPEIAWCGLTETEARERGIKVQAARFPWAASGRALTQRSEDGLTKLIVDPATEKVLGVGIVGNGAGETIAEGCLAVERGLTARELADVIHPHPTLSETLMESAESFYGLATHIHRPRKR